MNFLERARAALKTLLEQRDAKLAELDAFSAQLSEEENRNATPDEAVLVELALDEVRSLTEPIAEAQARVDELEAIEATRNKRNEPAPGAPGFVGRAGGGSDPYDFDLRSAPRTAEVRREVQDRAMRALEVDDYLSTDERSHVEAMLRDRKVNVNGALARHILTTGAPEYREAFLQLVTRAHPILTEKQAHLVNQAESLRATIEVGTDANGGYLMPFTLDPTVILTSTGVVNPVRTLASVSTVATDNWQGITSAGITASYDAEGTQVSDDSPTFGQPAIEIHQAQAWAEATVQATDDLDSLGSELQTMFADAKDRLELTVFTTGTGSDQPYGFVTDATKVASAGSDTYAVGDVYALQEAVDPRWQQNATWQASLPVINLTRQFGTALGHTFLEYLSGGQPPQLLGQDLYRNSGMDSSITAAADNYVLAYGDMRQYRIKDRIGMTVQFVPVVMGANQRPIGKSGWYVRWRNGARLSVSDAVKVLNVT